MLAHTRSAPEDAWFKSSYSGANATECVEVAATAGAVLIRDSKRPAGERIAIAPEAWTGFVTSLHGRPLR
ncbi:DUF397 domain-containing protein [Streptomyces sp. NPDC053474]|uniref:DUF397 domain-containing protein n=1 Tax=Streptomyces sp. NPDC053474 TaxID=3365704 RepID=UPI0037D4454F